MIHLSFYETSFFVPAYNVIETVILMPDYWGGGDEELEIWDYELYIAVQPTSVPTTHYVKISEENRTRNYKVLSDVDSKKLFTLLCTLCTNRQPRPFNSEMLFAELLLHKRGNFEVVIHDDGFIDFNPKEEALEGRGELYAYYLTSPQETREWYEALLREVQLLAAEHEELKKYPPSLDNILNMLRGE